MENSSSRNAVVLLNGPKSCGKTKAIEYLKGKGLELTYRSCKTHLHSLVMSLFHVEEELYWHLYKSRTLKEFPSSMFRLSLSSDELVLLEYASGLDLLRLPEEEKKIRNEVWGAEGISVNLSPREAMIYVSEVVCKPRFGENYFGKVRAQSIQEGEWSIDDSTAAFEVNQVVQADELTPLIQRVGNEDILLIRVMREGFGFEGDSRRYVPDGVCENTYDIVNDVEEDFYEQVYQLTCEFLGVAWQEDEGEQDIYGY